jgi:hypothetical protein
MLWLRAGGVSLKHPHRNAPSHERPFRNRPSQKRASQVAYCGGGGDFSLAETHPHMRDPSETDPHKIGPSKLWLGAGVGCTLSPHAKKERLLKETLLDSTLKGVVADILLLRSCF